MCSAVSEHVVLSDAWASFASFAPRRADAHDQRVVASSAQEAAGSRMPSPPTAESRMLDTVTSVTDESTHTLVQDSVLAVPDLLLSVGSKRRATRSTGLAVRLSIALLPLAFCTVPFGCATHACQW
ncbi:hypothetical protein EON66_07270 [archaeon]|nr:MAG: hypothetical protein EON66_07270 [archaeon]